jgi:glycosyltransferase involved in cell wall biosynthesis
MARLLQICPHDSAPFDQICLMYERAATSLGHDVTTVFLSSPTSSRMSHATYLRQRDLAATSDIAAELSAMAQSQSQSQDPHAWSLVICHRYRAYWSAVRSTLANVRIVAVAHEYGFFAKWQRRLGRRLRAKNVTFAGVAPGIVVELAAVAGHANLLPNVIDGMDLHLLPMDKARQRLGISSPSPLIGIVGRLHYKKRPQFALAILEELFRRLPAAKAVFIGDGPEREQLMRVDNSRIVFSGNVPNAVEVFPAFDVLLHAGDADAFGMVILEAMYAGVPVVTGRGRGPEYILGELGSYAETDDVDSFVNAIEVALDLDRNAFAAAATQRVQAYFSVGALARLLDELLLGTASDRLLQVRE